MFRDPDVPLVPKALIEGYREMRAAEGDAPSPVLATYAGMQRPEHSDVLVVDQVDAPRGAVVFLHGYGGSFALPCWQLARAAAAAGFITYCPSLRPRADWWSADGERIVRETMRLAAARGLGRIVLAGLSNGAMGAARLAPRMRGSLVGLVLVSGAPADAAAPNVPALVIHGRHDSMASAAAARSYASIHHAKYVDLDAGHFALLVRREESMRAFREWLIAR